jgi:hypothetical protein
LAFIGSEKRNVIVIQNTKEVEVLNIPIEKMIIKYENQTVYFKRLGFKGCPSTKVRSGGTIYNLPNGAELEDMNRWGVVREIYSIFIRLDRKTRTKVNIFNAIVTLIRYCDENGIEDFYSKSAIVGFVGFLKEKYHKGIKGKTLMMTQNSVKVILFEINPVLLDDLKSTFLALPDDSSSAEPYSDDEVRKIVSSLYKVFNEYRKCILSGTTPQVHPLYNEEILVKNNNFNYSTESSWKKKLYSKNSNDTWRNDLIKTAFFLTSFYTGANEAALLNLKVSDISSQTFNQVSSGSYVLKTIKERQGGKENFIEIGFSKKAKEFFETWLILRKIILKCEFDYVFPSIVKGKVKKSAPASVAVTLNNTFALLGIPLLSTQRFRKTKALLIMRATESIFAVAEGLNNSAETVSKHYANGVPETMAFSLAGALDVRLRTLSGETLSRAIIESSYHFSDPVREHFYKKNQLAVPSIVLNGLRCKDSFGDKAKQLKSLLVKAGLAKQKNTVACHKFLECFSCPHHAVIAEVDDIWLMLSFRDVILEVSCQPSINTMPTNTLTKIVCSVESILERLRQEFSIEYKHAEAKYLASPHPLWSDKADLDTLLELYY